MNGSNPELLPLHCPGRLARGLIIAAITVMAALSAAAQPAASESVGVLRVVKSGLGLDLVRTSGDSLIILDSSPVEGVPLNLSAALVDVPLAASQGRRYEALTWASTVSALAALGLSMVYFKVIPASEELRVPSGYAALGGLSLSLGLDFYSDRQRDGALTTYNEATAQRESVTTY